MATDLRRPSVLLVLVALVGALSTVSAPAAEASPRDALESRVELRLTDLHLRARADAGRATIPAWTDLRDQARRWSDFQADGRCSGGATICHNTGNPDGRGLGADLCCWRGWGENVAWRMLETGSASLSNRQIDDLADRLMAGWMDSSGHRGNILGTGWDDLGVSAAYRRTNLGGGRYRHEVFATGVFRTRSSTPPGQAYRGATAVEPRGIDAACRSTASVRFADISRDSVVGRAAGCIAAWDVTQGKGDGSYDPRGRVSRGQMASFLDRALAAVGRRPPAPSTTRFRDARGTTHEAAIERLAGAGLVAGRADGTYGPQDPVTRAQMATFLRRAYEHAARRTLPEPAVPFSDVAGSPHTPAIAAVAGTGIAAGTGPGTYDPNANVTRAQMAQFLARWLDLAVTDGLATGPR